MRRAASVPRRSTPGSVGRGTAGNQGHGAVDRLGRGAATMPARGTASIPARGAASDVGLGHGNPDDAADIDGLPTMGGGRGHEKRAANSLPCSVRSVRARARASSTQTYNPPRSTPSTQSQPTDGHEDNDDVEGTLHGSMKEPYDKAEWNFDNTRVFLEICIQEVNAGNRVNGTMTTRGYKNISEKYKIATGLFHSKLQLKNKLDLLKGLYAFWLQLNRDTGLGWNEALGTVVATEEYWNNATKGHSHWKQLKKGPPEHEDLLQEMFGGIVVDGSSSCVPGEVLAGNDKEGTDGGEFDGDDNTDQYASPAASMRRNPQSSLATASTATSPSKKTKNQMVKVMRNIHATLEVNCSIANKVMLGDHLEEKIKEVQSMAVRCGAKEGSVEHFMATQLFKHAENRACFKAFETDEGRLLWLKRWCAKEGLI